jgi:hypothetical protein
VNNGTMMDFEVDPMAVFMAEKRDSHEIIMK